MTNRIDAPPVQPDTSDAPPARGRLDGGWPMQGACLTAGIGILLIVPLAVVGYLVAVQGLMTPGDAEKTASDILASEGVFRLGIACLFVNIVLDVVVAWALFRVFSPVSSAISMLAAWCRIVFAGVFLVAIGELFGVLRLLGNDGYLSVLSADQLQAQALLRINTFTDIWDAGFVLFGVHLVLLGYLAYRSGFVPRIIGVLLVIAGLGYLTDSLGGVLIQGYTADVGAFTFLGELLLGLWLLIRARHIAASAAAQTPSSTTPGTGSPTAADAGTVGLHR